VFEQPERDKTYIAIAINLPRDSTILESLSKFANASTYFLT
jgi:hypothetical protein